MRIATLGFIGILGTGGMAIAQVTPPPAPAAPTAPKAKMMAAVSGSYIGVNVQEVDSERAKALKLREEAGVEVTRVEPDSPAEKAGLKSGDVILQYNGQRVEGMEQFSRLVHETPPGRPVKLDVFRSGAAQAITVTAGARHNNNMTIFAGPPNVSMPAIPAMPAPRAFEFRMPDMPHNFMSWQSSVLGIEGESLDGQLAQYFGVKEGVLVRSVSSGSAAEKAGFKAGDVIVRVEDSKVATPADVSNRIRSIQGKQVAIVVVRDRKEVPLTVAIDDNHRAECYFQDFVGSNEGKFFAGPEPSRLMD
jgi:serine protease Do